MAPMIKIRMPNKKLSSMTTPCFSNDFLIIFLTVRLIPRLPNAKRPKRLGKNNIPKPLAVRAFFKRACANNFVSREL